MPRPLIAVIVLLVLVGFLARDTAFMHSIFNLVGAIAYLIWTLVSLPFRLIQVAIQRFTGA